MTETQWEKRMQSQNPSPNANVLTNFTLEAYDIIFVDEEDCPEGPVPM